MARPCTVIRRFDRDEHGGVVRMTVSPTARYDLELPAVPPGPDGGAAAPQHAFLEFAAAVDVDVDGGGEEGWLRVPAEHAQ